MNPTLRAARVTLRVAPAALVAMLIGNSVVVDQVAARAQNPPPASATQSGAVKIPPEQLDSLVAPIALYPDPLLAQTLAASTYPLELVQLQQWLKKNSGLKDKALADAVAKQPWDPSIQSMAALPEVVNRLANDIQWTADLGNAFLAQQTDVLTATAVRANGSLTSTAYSIDHLRHACVPNMRSIASRKGRSITAGNTSEEDLVLSLIHI